MLRAFGKTSTLQAFASLNGVRTTVNSMRLASTGHVAPSTHGHDDHHHAPYVPTYREKIGQREVVGFGWNGEPDYFDCKSFPYPSIRWEAPNDEINALREKEKGDWHGLSIDEKKRLYRASFRETYAEMDAPTGEWKFVAGLTMLLISVGLWTSVIIRSTMPPLPISMDDEHRLAQLQRMIGLGVGHVDGLSSWWDYEKGQWKE